MLWRIAVRLHVHGYKTIEFNTRELTYGAVKRGLEAVRVSCVVERELIDRHIAGFPLSALNQELPIMANTLRINVGHGPMFVCVTRLRSADMVEHPALL